ncbi:MAG: hypothetical protein ACLGHA_09720 [Gammaproteobacteria bacterium]
MGFQRIIFTSLAWAVPAIFIGLALGLAPDAVIDGAAAAAGAFAVLNYRPS